MRRTLYAGVAATLALAIGGGAATAGAVGKTGPAVPHRLVSHRFTEHVLLGVLNPGENIRLLAGVTTGTFGQGGAVLHNHRITANTGKGTVTLYSAHGALSGTYTISASVGGPVGPKGYTIVQGKGTLTSGTEAFKGAHGSFTFKGKSPAGVEYFIITLRGSYS
jgi:hypothetical protein